ncbi:glycosyltransferase family 2 protein [Synechococcus sp. PCC 7336]|uniref:glycosyltransferase family 2 protein n=1 Tax=Synechococcus sp. PCC 7336 TaxID=195250 RepID=UPI0003452E39|nr:glycosyltransferase family 2 protein [Synechococcus sp. PCC 7336]
MTRPEPKSVKAVSGIAPEGEDPQETETSPAAPQNTVAIVPVLNESATIGRVVEDLRSQGIQHIRVIDNGSSDDSAQKAAAAGAEVLFEPIAGYGRACWRGLQDLGAEIEWVLFCDGDGSDDLSQLPLLFAQGDRADFILGNRQATAAGRATLTPVQTFGNGLATTLIRWGWGFQYRDLGPLRLLRRAALERLQLNDRGFGWTLEMQVRAVEENLRICELPVNYRPRQGGKSKISGSLRGAFRAGSAILGNLGRLYWSRSERNPRENSNAFPAHLRLWLAALLLVVGAVAIAPHGNLLEPGVGVVPQFWWGVGLMGVGFGLSWTIPKLDWRWFWGVTIATRLILLGMAPGDDVWRYLWEGFIQTQGFNPYQYAPNAIELEALRFDWWPWINHPHVSALYPPVVQWGFHALAAIQPSVLLFKLGFVAADLIVCGLLYRWFSGLNAVLYAWNPLVIYSFAGGAHYDSWFILPLVLAWGIADRGSGLNRWLGSALCVGIAIAVKWVSLPLLGFLAWRAGRDRHLPFGILVGAIGLLPLAIASLSYCLDGTCPISPADSDFLTYGRSAEAVPYLVWAIWPFQWKTNWLLVAPLAAIIAISIVRSRHLLGFAERYFIALLFLSPIIHAWYFTWLLPFAAATRNWGARLVSISAFIYFVLPHRQALGDTDWWMTETERLLLWLPFAAGCLWSGWVGRRRSPI